MSSKDEEFLKKLISIFKVESKDRIEKISEDLLALEKSSSLADKKSMIESIFREIHSLKGAARSVNFQKAEFVCKGLEDVFSIWKNTNQSPSAEQLDILHRINDALMKVIEMPELPLPSQLEEDVKLIVQGCNVLNADSGNNNKLKHEVKIIEPIEKQTKPDKPKLENSNQTEKLEKIEAFRSVENSDLYEKPETKFNVSASSESGTQKIDTNIKIASSKLDTVLVQSEEMLTTRISISQRMSELTNLRNEIYEGKKEWEKLDKVITEKIVSKQHSMSDQKNIFELIKFGEDHFRNTLKKMDGIITKIEHDFHQFSTGVNNLLEDTKKLLMLPFSTLLTGFPKTIRDVSRKLYKDVNFVTEGGDVEIDKRILDEMKDIFIHLIRNAIDHGIERPEERKKLNKPEQGTIKLTIKQLAGNEIMIEFTDDGGGVNLEAIKKAAIKQGVISLEDSEKMSKDEAMELIFHSGLSATPILTDLSGRGLGMAIIREKIEKISGKITISSQSGVGTSIKIHLPLTIATFKGMLIRVAGQLFVIPTANLESVLRIKVEDIKTVENVEVISYLGSTTSLVRLEDMLEMRDKTARKADEISETYRPVIIITSSEKRVGFMVDEILGEQEILVKNFSKPLVRIKNIAATAILGTGKPVLILNCTDLLQTAHTIHLNAARKTDGQKSAKNIRLLLVEDSITTRMLLKNILELGGYQVTTAVDGLEAWNILQRDNFSAVVSDVDMPKMNGFELTQKIRKENKFENIPVILVTARESDQDRERGIDVGANAYILKSTFDSTALLQSVKHLTV